MWVFWEEADLLVITVHSFFAWIFSWRGRAKGQVDSIGVVRGEQGVATLEVRRRRRLQNPAAPGVGNKEQDGHKKRSKRPSKCVNKVVLARQPRNALCKAPCQMRCVAGTVPV
jgi:hypothetical protein